MVKIISAKRPNKKTVSFKDFSKVYAQKTSNKGFGLFAKKNIKKDEIIFYARGVKIHNIDNDYAPDYPDALRISKNTWINPNEENPLTYTNHSCNPNTSIKGSTTFCAIKEIKKDQEVTFDYALSEIDTEWIMDGECLCGNINCRKVIKSIQFLPKSQLKKYIPNIPTWIKKFLNI